jgi:CO/xanthine dehydrogenase FAD-binding subunit
MCDCSSTRSLSNKVAVSPEVNMILEYHRPPTIDKALELLSRPSPKSYPLGGGTRLSHNTQEDFAVVDLQNLNLNGVLEESGRLLIGACVRLQGLIDSSKTPTWLKNASAREAGRNLREMETIAGLLMSANGRSPLAIALLAADIHARVLPGDEGMTFPQLLSVRKNVRQPWLITQITFDAAVDLQCEFIARSPVDLPVLGIAAARWPSGRTRIAVGGFGEAPLLAFDGDKIADVLPAVAESLKDGGDEWASAEYRRTVASVMVKRLLHEASL